jgi:hypothetical protein
MEFTDGQKAKILKYLLTGLGVGAGTNLTLNLISYLRDKQTDADISNKDEFELSGNKNVYEIDPKELQWLEKQASQLLSKTASAKSDATSNTIAQAIAILAATGGMYGGYKLSDLLHDKVKEDELKDQSEAEKEAYYKNLFLLQQAAQAKHASENSNAMKKIAGAFSSAVGTGLGLMLLTALGSAWASREFMKKQYPKLKLQDVLDTETNALFTKSPDLPVFVVKEKEDKENKESDGDQYLKPNESVELDSDNVKDLTLDKHEVPSLDENNDPFSKLEKFSFEKHASYINEAILTLCYNMEKFGDKQGSVTSLVKSAAEGYTDSLRTSVEDFNPDYTIFDVADDLNEKFCKSAYSKEKEQIALTWLATDPTISSAIMPQVVAEYMDHTPVFSKMATVLPENPDLYLGLLVSSVVKNREDAFAEVQQKIASEISNIDFSKSYDKNEVEFADCLATLLNSSYQIHDSIVDALK